MSDNSNCNDDNQECKYFHHEPYMTPNNYDLFFDYNSIPVNIQPEKAHDLRNRLQKLMPLTKIIHLNMDDDILEEDNNFHLHTRLKLSYDVFQDSVETQIKLTGVWDDLEESSKSTVTYTVCYLYGEESPINNATVNLINLHYPLMQYSCTTGADGVCVFEDLPYGTYVRQLLINNYSIPPEIIEINEPEVSGKLLIGSSEENVDTDDDTSDDVNLNLYKNGVFISPSLVYDNGNLTSTGDVVYNAGKLSITEENELADESAITILINTPGFNVINDYTEFNVDIVGVDGEVVDSLILNFENNYTRISKVLPLYNGDTKINYSLDYTQEHCNVNKEYYDLPNFTTKEQVLL